MKYINPSEVVDLSVSHIRLNGRVNVSLFTQSETLELYNLTLKQATSLEKALKKNTPISIDSKLMILADDIWQAQNLG